MKVKCISTEDKYPLRMSVPYWNSHSLITVGNMYDVLEINCDYYRIINNDGHHSDYHITNFKNQLELREDLLNDLLK